MHTINLFGEPHLAESLVLSIVCVLCDHTEWSLGNTPWCQEQTEINLCTNKVSNLHSALSLIF